MKKISYFIILVLFYLAFSILFSLQTVSASCWQQTTESNCLANTDATCKWKNDSWGAWCQEVNCWSLWNQTDCDTTNIPGKNCSWSGGGTSWSCTSSSCYNFGGTNETACVNNSANLGCDWGNYCWRTDWSWSAGGTDCSSLTSEATCRNSTGCSWGSCNTKNCWSTYTSEADCRAGKDWKGNNCTWVSSTSHCTENWCGKYNNQTDCNGVTNLDSNEDQDCIWKWNYCQDIQCWNWDFTNASVCANNTANLSCKWDGSYCMEKGCWNYGETECNENPTCLWNSYTTAGWCNEVQCWNWDSFNYNTSGGGKSACDGNSSLYSLGCIWEDSPGGTPEEDGWCYKDSSSLNCSNFTTERQCMDTFYCWWQYTDFNNPALGGTCSDPSWGGTGFSSAGVFNEWNPGCYIFDANSSNCGLIIGCDNSTTEGFCITNSTHENNLTITTGGINCTMMNDSSLCNSVSILASCCSWQNGTCAENKMTTSCWDQMSATPEGAGFCEDYNSYTDYSKCTQIAGDPWYMSCEWNNATERCSFKAGSVFGNSSQSLVKIDNKKNCESASGKWVTESYCEGNQSVSAGRCEYKCDDETNCDKACFACEKYDSNGYVVNSSNAESACKGSALGYCEFTANTNASNGIGYCKAKEQFKKGVSTNCNTECGDCTYMGDSISNVTGDCSSGCITPSCYCACSNANSVGGGCKWTTDNSTNQGGYCINKGELTCEDTCDRCSTQDNCITIGAKNKRNSTFENSSACEWDNANSLCKKTGQTAEICWDGIDNTEDGLIDCADSGCYSDAYCGFVEGNCFGWPDNETCISNDCDWITDNWGAWCDFKGSNCWKSGSNSSICGEQSNCKWNNGTGNGWCEQDWSIGEFCMGKGYTSCIELQDSNNCTWTNDTYCAKYPSNETSWCLDFGGWCDYSAFAPKNCWLYDTNKTGCQQTSGCNWSVGGWFEPHCEVDYSSNCWNYYDSSNCISSGCYWKQDNWGAWCTSKSSICYDKYNQADCVADNGNFTCRWDSNYCQPACNNYNITSSDCSATSGCIWKEESGWCSEIFTDQMTCWNSTNSNTEENCGATSGCRWKNPGSCDPIGFGGGGVATAFGFGGAMGDSCYKYDGNKSLCTNSSEINMSCGWMDAYSPFCDIKWNLDCWNYYDNNTCTDAGCYWYNGTDDNSNDANNYCMNPGDICWKNESISANQNNCDNNIYCNWSSFGSCQSACFSSERSDETECNSNFGCRWVNGWCNPAGTASMFSGMQEGPPVELGRDSCGDGTETLDEVIDICGFGMKDMGDSYGFGINVFNFANSSVCNNEKLSSSLGGGFGNGNKTVKFYWYLDTDGNSSKGCALAYDTTIAGFEFRFNYDSVWNDSLSKADEVFTVFKCKNDIWEGSDVKLSIWKAKMCGEIGGPIVAVKKSDLERFPELYDSTKDIRVLVASANDTTNITSPADSASAGYTTPGAIDFEVSDMFSYGANTAKSEDTLRQCFVSFEDCFNSVDDDDDGLVDCNDYDCKYSSKCNATGVNSASFVDTTAPRLIGAKIEEYSDAALIIYDTTKPANGTLFFYHNDSNCLNLNSTIYDIGVLKNNSIREYRTSLITEIYNSEDGSSLDYALENDTTYYYKLKVCDEAGRCGQSRCSSFTTLSSSRCSYCEFVARIQVPEGWDVNYDIDQDGTYESIQGKVCGPNAGLRVNYTDARRVDIRLNRTDGSSYIDFFNATLTKTGLNSKTRKIDSENAFRNGTTTETGGNTIGYVGMISETRDKIINNLHPERCVVKIPGMTDELWHCADNLDPDSCMNRTTEANLTESNDTGTGYRIWEIPFCEFSVWAGGKPAASTTTTTSSAGASSASGGAGLKNKTAEAGKEGGEKEGEGEGTAPGTTPKSGLEVLKEVSAVLWILIVIAVALVVSYILFKRYKKKRF